MRLGKLVITAISLLLVAAGSVSAQQAKVEKLEVLQSGLYRAEVTEQKSAPSTATGQVATISRDAVFYDSASRVPAKIGVAFGVKYRLVGSPDGAEVVLRSVVRFPPPGLRDSATGRVSTEDVLDIAVGVGEEMIRGYAFEHEWELIAGDWILEFWEGPRRLFTRTFSVYRP